MAVSNKLKSAYFGFFDGIETFAANRISNFQQKRYLSKYLDKKAKLTKEEKKEIAEFWKPYCKVSNKWARYYSSKNGIFDPRYIPNTLYYTKIDQHFNARKLGYGFNDKNYYSLLFPNIKQPNTVVRKIGGLLFDSDYKQITFDEAIEIIQKRNEIIAKPSQETGSGRGIEFLKTDTDIEEIKKILKTKSIKNLIIQDILKQHHALEEIHPCSLNTLRICSILLDDGVHILSSVLRMGVNNSRIDNVSSGGISVAIKGNGVLAKYAYTCFSGERFEVHPQGVVFENYKIPYFDAVIETVKKAAQVIGNFRLVSWDMSINEEGEPVLIEANMRKGGINVQQFNIGPLFGDLTDRVLKEVFSKKQK